MKRTFALLLSVMMALAVTACGKDDNAATSGAGSGSASSSVNDGAGSSHAGSSANSSSGSGVSDNGNRVDDGAPGTDAGAADSSMSGLENNGTGSSNDSTGSTTVPQRGTLKGATYGQMLRNGQVHDRDGYLLDGENAVTPGTAR